MSDAYSDLLAEFSRDRWKAHAYFFRHRHREESPRAHAELVDAIYRPVARGSIEGFRGLGKSSLLEESAVVKAVYREFHNLVLLGSSYTRARDRLAAIKRELEMNEDIRELFGEQRGSVWREERIVLKSGICIQAIGREQSMVGMKYMDWRPDAALVDDVEDPEEIRTDAERAQTWRWFIETFLPSLDDPVGSWVRVLGTRRGKGSLPERLEDDGWPVVKFPVEYRDAAGERAATWPAKFPLQKVDQMRRTYRGNMDTWAQEYMCEAQSATDRPFTREMIRVVPRERRWEAVYAMIDPARSVGKGSAATGWAAWSWVNRRLVVWEAAAPMLLPDEVVKLAFRIQERFSPVWLGVEQTGLSQWLLQPIRQEQMRRGVLLPLKPVHAIEGTRGQGQTRFIYGLQPFYAHGEVIHAQPLADLESQILSFPHGARDALNALAYAPVLRTGEPVFDSFAESHIAEALSPQDDKPCYLAGNTDGRVTSAILLQMSGGELKILADWVREGVPADLVADIHAEAALLVETGRWEERIEYGEGEDLLKTPVASVSWQRHPLRWVIPAWHGEIYRNQGLQQAIKAIPQGVSLAAGGNDRGRREVARLLSQMHQGGPRVRVSPYAGWTLRAFAGGYARPLGRNGLAEAEPEKGVYRVLMEGLEAFAAVGTAAAAEEGVDAQPLAWTRQGVPYRAAVPMGRR